MTQYAAFLKNAPLSAQKCRLAADAIRGCAVQDASDALAFPARKSEVIMRKVLDSAVANAENDFGAGIDELFVETVCVDEAMRIPRFRARARGRAAGYTKHRCHVRIVLSDGIDEAASKDEGE